MKNNVMYHSNLNPPALLWRILILNTKFAVVSTPLYGGFIEFQLCKWPFECLFCWMAGNQRNKKNGLCHISRLWKITVVIFTQLQMNLLHPKINKVPQECSGPFLMSLPYCVVTLAHSVNLTIPSGSLINVHPPTPSTGLSAGKMDCFMRGSWCGPNYPNWTRKMYLLCFHHGRLEKSNNQPASSREERWREGMKRASETRIFESCPSQRWRTSVGRRKSAHPKQHSALLMNKRVR